MPRFRPLKAEARLDKGCRRRCKAEAAALFISYAR